jgi:hypothetical protein
VYGPWALCSVSCESVGTPGMSTEKCPVSEVNVSQPESSRFATLGAVGAGALGVGAGRLVCSCPLIERLRVRRVSKTANVLILDIPSVHRSFKVRGL